jgi:hypothetical protein
MYVSFSGQPVKDLIYGFGNSLFDRGRREGSSATRIKAG